MIRFVNTCEQILLEILALVINSSQVELKDDEH